MNERFLQIETRDIRAGAIFQKDAFGVWRCIFAAPVISGLRGLTDAEAEGYADGRGWVFHWTGCRIKWTREPSHPL